MTEFDIAGTIDPVRLRAAMGGHSIASLAKASGVSTKSLGRWLDPDQKPTRPQFDTLQPVAKVLGCEPGDLLRKNVDDIKPALPRARSPRSDCRVAHPAELLRDDYGGRDLVRELSALDHELWDGIDEEEHGNISQYADKWSILPDFGRLLVDEEERRIVGYWSAVPMELPADRKSLYSRIKSGQFRDGDFNFREAANVDTGGDFALYISSIGILERYRTKRGNLLASFVDFLEEQTRDGVFFKYMAARAFTTDGHHWCKGFHMDPVKVVSEACTVFERSLFPFPKRPIFEKRRELQAAYADHYGDKSPF